MASKPGRAPTAGTRRGNGAGYGGPAKGADPQRRESLRLADGEYNPNPAGGTAPSASTVARRERAMAVLDTAMEEGETWTVKVLAADKILDRIEGKAIARTVPLTKDEYDQLTDAELAAERARIDAALAEARADRAGEGVPAEPAGVVH